MKKTFNRKKILKIKVSKHFCDHCGKELEKDKYHGFKFQHKYRDLCNGCFSELEKFFKA